MKLKYNKLKNINDIYISQIIGVIEKNRRDEDRSIDWNKCMPDFHLFLDMYFNQRKEEETPIILYTPKTGEWCSCGAWLSYGQPNNHYCTGIRITC